MRQQMRQQILQQMRQQMLQQILAQHCSWVDSLLRPPSIDNAPITSRSQEL